MKTINTSCGKVGYTVSKNVQTVLIDNIFGGNMKLFQTCCDKCQWKYNASDWQGIYKKLGLDI